jgi:sulfoxide reductase heme-binding subunit YedZ
VAQRELIDDSTQARTGLSVRERIAHWVGILRSFAERFRAPLWLRSVVFVASCIPAAVVVFWLISDALWGTRYLGANPIVEAEHVTGEWALRFLMFTLAVTPARWLFGWNWLGRYRRMWGLFAFFYACVHLLLYLAVEMTFNLGDVALDLFIRPYVLVGLFAFLFMAPLALTSTAAMVRRLGKRWTRLHRLTYVVVVLGVIHFWWAVKKDVEDPIIFAAIFLGLFALRWLRGWIAPRRERVASA